MKRLGLARRWASDQAKNLIATYRALGMTDDEIKVALESTKPQ